MSGSSLIRDIQLFGNFPKPYDLVPWNLIEFVLCKLSLIEPEYGFGLSLTLFPLKGFDTDPVLKFSRLDHIKHGQEAARITCPAGCEEQRAFAFRRFIGNDQKFSLVTGFVDLTFGSLWVH